MNQLDHNQFQQCFKISKLKILILTTTLLIVTSCLKHSSQDVFYIPQFTPLPTIEIYYDHTQVLTNATSHSVKNYQLQNLETVTSSRPTLKKKEGKVCLFSHQSTFQNSESGLQFRLCLPTFQKNEATINEVLSDFNHTKNAKSQFSTTGIHIFYKKYNSLLKGITNIDYSIDGSYKFHNSLSTKNITSNHFAAYLKDQNPLLFSKNTLSLPRTFPFSGFDLIISANNLYFIYRQESIAHEVLVIKISNDDLVTSSRHATHKLFSILKKQNGVSKGNAQLIEFYSGNKDNAYIQFQSGTQSGNYDISISSTTGYTFKRRIFLHANSIIIFSKDTVENFYSSGSFFSQGILWNKDYQLQLRSQRFSIEHKKLLPSIFCSSTYLQVCGFAGLPLFPTKTFVNINNKPLCSALDIKLTEVNFSGIKTQEGIDPKGRFLEFQSERECYASNLVLLSGTSKISFPQETIKKGNYIIFSGNTDYFVESKSLYKIQNYRLRYLNQKQSIFIIDLWRLQTTNIYTPSLTKGYVQHWGNTGPVHSLQPVGTQYTLNTSTACGIRPDLVDLNRMNPACVPGSPLVYFKPIISEVLPAGARNNEGTSLPEEEFIELATGSPILNDHTSNYSIFIYNKSLQLIQNILIPPLQAQNTRVILSRNSIKCDLPHQIHSRYKNLRLPNSGLSLAIKENLASLQYMQIKPEVAASLNLYIRKSYSLIRKKTNTAPSVWRPSSQGITTQCNLNTWANPGEAPRYNAFVLETENTGTTHWDIFTNKNTSIQWDFYDSQNILYHSDFLSVSNPTRISHLAKINTGRNLVLSYLHSVPFFASELQEYPPDLYFQTIAPTPLVGDVEWIRICTTTGFSINDHSLHIQDSLYHDQIIPASHRIDPDAFPITTALLNTNTLSLTKGSCAILVDPDYNNQHIPLRPNDTSLWTISQTAAIGNGISSGEGLLLYKKNTTKNIKISSIGLVDAPQDFQFTIPSKMAECVERKPHTYLDQQNNFEVQQCN